MQTKTFALRTLKSEYSGLIDSESSMMMSKITMFPLGPRARELIEPEIKQFHQSSIDGIYPIFTKNIYGTVIEDDDSNKYLDFANGSGSMSFGETNPELVKVVNELIEDLVFASFPGVNETVIKFAENSPRLHPVQERRW